MQIAGIETATEQIGGFTFTGGISANILESAVNEGIEEVISELATNGTTYDEQGNAIYEKPLDVVERVLTAGVSGALSGGIMTGGAIWYNVAQKDKKYY